ncbi:lipoxygenase homology domain-containing protein 1 isoform X2 [Patella vulgata]|uniref:lipoxygenase homology domain-containing protein 1 isoform X2 n=1 Tax=Patella vulgata TaxID=6465 RepID=UPI0024A90853|nr:lipoxygenase homology domain-containing protein 1 isoform X2 [Patella vulgata]
MYENTYYNDYYEDGNEDERKGYGHAHGDYGYGYEGGYGYEREEENPVQHLNDDVRLTWAGPISTSLYGEHIQKLSRKTESNLDRLRSTMSCSDLYKPSQNNSKLNSMFSVNNSGPYSISSASIDDTASISSTGFNFCYLCSTLEEHQKNHLHNHPKKTKKPRKPRIEYIAPLPHVKRKPREPLTASHEALYKVVVYVGDVPGASSDANVFISIIGSRDELPKQRLCRGKKTTKFCFVRGAVEKFYVKGPKLGNLRILTIEHDGFEKRHGLYLDKIEVTDMMNELTWVFVCKNWLSLHHGDFCIRRDLEAVQKEQVVKEYEITMVTGNKRLAGTDARVFLTLQGTQKTSQKIHLNRGKSGKDHFNKGGTDKFQISLRDIGEIKSIRVEHDGKGFADGWFLDKIIIKNTADPKETYYFVYGGWIATDEGDGSLWRDLKAKRKLDKILLKGRNIRYQVTVRTGEVKYAGTDANVFIQFVGPKGSTKQLKLDDSRNNFEKGMVEMFEVTGIDVGDLDHIVIGHDNAGMGAGWFLDYVIVKKYFTKPQIKEKLEKLRSGKEDGRQDEGQDVDKYVAMGRRRSSMSRKNSRKSFDEDDDEDRKDRRRDRSRSKLDAEEIFDRDGNVVKVPFYEEYYFDHNQWLATNEGDGLTQREVKPSRKQIYYSDKVDL